MSRGPKPKPLDQRKLSKVIRVSKRIYDRLNHEKLKSHGGHNEILELMLDVMDLPQQYICAGKLCSDLAEARGYAIGSYVKTKKMERPKIVVVLGEDRGL